MELCFSRTSCCCFVGRRSGEHRADAFGAEKRGYDPADRRRARAGSGAVSRAAATDGLARDGRRQAHRARPGDHRRPTDHARTGQSPATTSGNWTTRGYADSRIANSRTGHLAD